MANIFRVFHIFAIFLMSLLASEIRCKDMRNEQKMSYCTSINALTSLSHSYKNIGDHRLGKTKN